jgi:hypothetical protein
MIWYLATCLNCTPVLPQPFYSEDHRNGWAELHRIATKHIVVYDEETR